MIEHGDPCPPIHLILLVRLPFIRLAFLRQVTPFCGLLHEASPLAPRLLLNREKVGERAAGREAGFRFDDTDNYRDAALLMSCDQGVALLARHLGWEQDLEALVKAAGCKAQFPLLPPVAAEGRAEGTAESVNCEAADKAEKVAAAMSRQWRGRSPPLRVVKEKWSSWSSLVPSALLFRSPVGAISQQSLRN